MIPGNLFPPANFHGNRLDCTATLCHHHGVKKIYNYPVLVDFEDGRYIASCPSFRGCVVQARTYEEAIEEITEGIVSFIEIHRKKHWPLPSDSTPFMTLVKVAVNE